MTLVEVVLSPGLDPTERPELTVSISRAELRQTREFAGSQGVNDLLVRNGIGFLVGNQGLRVGSVLGPDWVESDLVGYGWVGSGTAHWEFVRHKPPPQLYGLAQPPWG